MHAREKARLLVTSQWEHHYLEKMGFVPSGLSTLFSMDEEFGDQFLKLRELVFRDRQDGLPPVTKELILVVLDIAANNRIGALNHMRAARKRGLTRTQMMEALIACFLVLGVSSLTNVGSSLWEEWEDWKAQEEDPS